MNKTQEAILIAHSRGYTVNAEGTVLNSRGEPLKKLLKKYNGSTSYHYFTVKVRGVTKQIRIHQYVAYLKYGLDSFKPEMVTRHLNDSSLDNTWENIVIGTQPENVSDAILNGRLATRKLTPSQELEAVSMRSQGLSYRVISEELGVSQATIFRTLKRATS